VPAAAGVLVNEILIERCVSHAIKTAGWKRYRHKKAQWIMSPDVFSEYKAMVDAMAKKYDLPKASEYTLYGSSIKVEPLSAPETLTLRYFSKA
jgi:hypothetical protein